MSLAMSTHDLGEWRCMQLCSALASCAALSIALRFLLLEPPHAPELLAPAPLFSALMLWGGATAGTPAAAAATVFGVQEPEIISEA